MLPFDRWTRVRALALVGLLFWAGSPRVAAQAVPIAEVAFVLHFSPRPVAAADAEALPPVLRRRFTLALHRVSLERALREIATHARLDLSYSRAIVPLSRTVSVVVDSGTVAEALRQALVGVAVELWITRNDKAALVPVVPEGAMASMVYGTVAGRVTDAKTGLGVTGAEVFLEKTRWRTTTDTGGNYRLVEVDTGNYTLTVRRLGYAKQSRAVVVATDRTETVDVALEPAVTRLNEIVTTATGAQRRLELGNDITVLKADSIVRTQPVASVTDLLEGRVPGLTVQRTSGAPGDPARLRLRGAASPLRSNDPIVVVDGVRVYAEQSAKRSGNLADINQSSANTFATPSPLDYIDPNSIETVEVLKGPSAATLYGQDAANGVIVITTKKGKIGPARWIGSGEYGTTRMPGQYPDLSVRWGHLPADNTPVFCPIDGVPPDNPGAHCAGDSLVTFQLLSDPELTVLDRGRRTAGTVGVSGGASALTYNITGTYRDETGLVRLPTYVADRYQALHETTPPDWMQHPQHLIRWGATSQLTAQLGSKADVGLSVSFARTTQRRSSLERRLNELMTTYLDQASGTFYGPRGNDNRVVPVDGGEVLRNYFQRATDEATDFTSGVNLNWRPQTWLTLTADAGLNMVQRADETFLPRGQSISGAASQFNAADTVGLLNYGRGSSLVSTVNVRAAGAWPVGHGFNFRLAAGANYTGQSISDFGLASRDLPPGTSLLGGEITDQFRSVQDAATFGWYVEPSVAHRRFWLTTGLRLDGGSVYGSRLTLPSFPKLSLSYLVSDESFYPLKSMIPTLRLRLAYGRAGRQPGITDRLRLYGEPKSIWSDGQFASGVSLEHLGNTQLRPERSTELEGGFDADLLDDRLHLSFSGYRKTTDDALLSVPVAPSVAGDKSVFRNIGVIRNTGLEFTVGAQLVRQGPVVWGADLSVSQNRNIVVKLGPGVEPFYTDGSGSGQGVRVAAGYPLFGRWSKPILGYTDANGDGILEKTEVLLGDTAVYVGQTLPNYTANLHTTVSLWRGALAVSGGFLYEDGLAQLNGVGLMLAPFSRGWNDPTAPLADQVTLATTMPPNQTDYYWVQTVSTFRFNSLAVTYAVPTTLARRLGARTLSLSLQGENLGLWTNYRGLDPNVNAQPNGNDIIDAGVLPQPRTWQVRVNATY